VVEVVLVEPEIAPNAGSAARTCLAVGARLHLVRPLGFKLTDAALRRAGMDYWHEADVRVHPSYEAFRQAFATAYAAGRVFAFTTKASTRYTEVRYQLGDVLLFGPESRGLSEPIRLDATAVRIPMRSQARSLNLAVSVGVALYEVERQLSRLA
jgi:tRNA (cytidine/uridine-2'-O-)-methyltransferase